MTDKPTYATMTLSMKDAKVKLMHLKLEEDAGNFMEDFGRFLAPRLNETLVPIGFTMGCELALYDLQKGIDGFSGKSINNRLVGLPPIMYSLIRMRYVEMAKAVFPADFAAEVENYINSQRA